MIQPYFLRTPLVIASSQQISNGASVGCAKMLVCVCVCNVLNYVLYIFCCNVIRFENSPNGSVSIHTHCCVTLFHFFFCTLHCFVQSIQYATFAPDIYSMISHQCTRILRHTSVQIAHTVHIHCLRLQPLGVAVITHSINSTSSSSIIKWLKLKC